MPRFVRIVAPVIAAAAIALGGASSALAAPGSAASGSAARPVTWDLDAEWCFDDSPGYVYCFEVDGTARFHDTRAGSSVTVNERFHTDFYKYGVLVGESTEVSLLRSTYRADGTVTTQEVSHLKGSLGGETCNITIVWRQADYEVVVDHWSGGCA
jgi:hypothetical protein